MSRLSRDSRLAIALIALLALLTIAATIGQARAQSQERAPALSTSANAPRGGRALWLWLKELGYHVDNSVGHHFAVPAGMRLVMLLEPTVTITEEEWRLLDAWVEEGGTLVLAGGSWRTAAAMQHYDFWLDYMGEISETLPVQTPLLASPPPREPATVQARYFLQSGRDDYITHVAMEQRPLLVSFAQGQGRVVLCAVPFLFSNAGLKEPGNPALVLNLVSLAGPAGPIWFDEWHQGRRPVLTEVVGPEEWLRRTPAGNALLYAAAVVLLALALQGRRFGRPVPPPQNLARRAPLEYVSAIAHLGRRAGHRRAALRHYYQRLKRDLGRRYRLDPALPDDEYVARLAAYQPQIDAVALRQLLARLSRREPSETDMVQLAAQAAKWLKET